MKIYCGRRQQKRFYEGAVLQHHRTTESYCASEQYQAMNFSIACLYAMRASAKLGHSALRERCSAAE